MTYRWVCAPLMGQRDVAETLKAAYVYVIDLIEESPLAIIQKRVIAHFVVSLDERCNFVDSSQLTLRDDLSLDEYYGHVGRWNESSSSLILETKDKAVKYYGGHGVVHYGFREQMPVAPEDLALSTETQSSLLLCSRKLMDSFFENDPDDVSLII